MKKIIVNLAFYFAFASLPAYCAPAQEGTVAGQAAMQEMDLSVQEKRTNSTSDVDDRMMRAYTLKFEHPKKLDTLQKVSALLEPVSNTEKVIALKAFLSKRSVLNALKVLEASDTPESLAVAYRCLAEAHYAKGDLPKAMMTSVLSLAYHFSDSAERQLKFYVTGRGDSELSFRGSREDVIERLLTQVKGSYMPNTYRKYFILTSIFGLLPEFPYSEESLSRDPTEPAHMIVGFDDNYTYHGGVTILSAMLSANPNTRYVFHIPEDPDSSSPITKSHQKQLQEMAAHFPKGKFAVDFELYPADALPEEIANMTFSLWPRNILFKLYIPEFYSHLNKVMWLDSDLIIRSDLMPFYDQPLGDDWIVAVRDLNALDHLPRLGLGMEDAYVNAGVMLFDNKNLKDHMDLVREAILSNTDDPDFLMYPEQDVFAVAFKNHIKEISFQRFPGKKHYFKTSHWNWFYHTNHSSTQWDTIHSHFAHVIHMASKSRKPWNQKKSPFYWSVYPQKNDGVQNLYWALRAIGPWPTI